MIADFNLSGSVDERAPRGPVCDRHPHQVHVSHELQQVPNGYPDVQISSKEISLE